LKKQNRILSKACQSGGKNKDKQIRIQATEYLRLAGELNKKVSQSKEELCKVIQSQIELVRLMDLDYYQAMLIKHINLVERRLLKGEVIPQEEKLYSIFENTYRMEKERQI